MAANDIFQQQYQMQRFATEYYDRPIAVNDLGLMAYRHPHYTLDLLGLAYEEIRKARREGRDSVLIEALSERYGVGLAIIYPFWFEKRLPESWRLVARMYLSRPPTSPAGPRVFFFVTGAGDRERIVGLLRRFRPTLPEGVRLEIVAD